MILGELLEVLDQSFVSVYDKNGYFLGFAVNYTETRKNWEWNKYKVKEISIAYAYQFKVVIDYDLMEDENANKN